MSRSPMLAKVHIAKKELALEEDDYRAVLTRIAGKASSGDCDDRELDKLIAEFKRLGWKQKSNPAGRGKSTKPHVRKIFALWRDAVTSGAISDGSRPALLAFVKRQTGVDQPDWLTAKDANRVSEGLKAMIARQKKKDAN